MGKKKSANGKSKTETVLQLRGQYPDDTYKQLSERAAGLGVEVSPNYVATIISNAKKKQKDVPAVKYSAEERAAIVESAQSEDEARQQGQTIMKAMAAKKMLAAAIDYVEKCGSVDLAIGMLEELKRIR